MEVLSVEAVESAAKRIVLLLLSVAFRLGIERIIASIKQRAPMGVSDEQ
jgi:hypothetical protein